MIYPNTLHRHVQTKHFLFNNIGLDIPHFSSLIFFDKTGGFELLYSSSQSFVQFPVEMSEVRNTLVFSSIDISIFLRKIEDCRQRSRIWLIWRQKLVWLEAPSFFLQVNIHLLWCDSDGKQKIPCSAHRDRPNQKRHMIRVKGELSLAKDFTC